MERGGREDEAAIVFHCEEVKAIIAGLRSFIEARIPPSGATASD
jgi:hypothetical protein